MLDKPENSPMQWPVKETQVEKALKISRNGSATGMDRCPFEL